MSFDTDPGLLSADVLLLECLQLGFLATGCDFQRVGTAPTSPSRLSFSEPFNASRAESMLKRSVTSGGPASKAWMSRFASISSCEAEMPAKSQKPRRLWQLTSQPSVSVALAKLRSLDSAVFLEKIQTPCHIEPSFMAGVPACCEALLAVVCQPDSLL